MFSESISLRRIGNQVRIATAVVAMLILSACGSMPRHNETVVDKVSSLVFKGGPTGAVVFVDGAQVASILPKKSETIVPIKDGSHRVEVSSNGVAIYQRTVVLEDGMRKIVDLGKSKK